MPLGPRLLITAYSIAIEAVAWTCLVPFTLARAVGGRASARELLERLAWREVHSTTNRADRTSPVLVHAVSAGEMNAAAPLVAVLGASGHRVLLTTGTAAGLAIGLRLSGEQPAIDDCVYLPWDRRAVRGWLRRLAPAAVVVVETEIWPNLFTACKALRIPLFMVNGRIRPRDVWKYRLGRAFFQGVLDSADWIGAQSARDRDAFVAIGAPASRVQVAGNLKFDAARNGNAESAGLTPSGEDRPLLVAGSTHDPEERWLLECAQMLAAGGLRIRLVLAPRDTARAGGVSRLARACGLRTLAWSEWVATTAAPWDVLVLDHYAALRACYADADVVVMGGTFVPVGGHNILEPAAVAKPILVGPHVEEISALIEPFEDAGAVMQLSGTDPARALAEACRTLLEDPERARVMGEKARDVGRQGAGSAALHADAIVERLAALGR